jgi:hypothetical protein
MAVSQGWSEWVGGWFDAISKIFQNIVATPTTYVTYRNEVNFTRRAPMARRWCVTEVL